MNERIRQLAEQAGTYFGGGTTDYFGDYLPPYVSITDLDLEKFAELIVRECIDWCNANARDDGTAQRIAEDIKKDFGVEE
jgi:hypothetical protein